MTDIQSERRARATALLAQAGPEKTALDAMLVTHLPNLRYLTGFTGSNGALLLIRDARPLFYTDPRYTVQSKQQVSCKTRIAKGTLTTAILRDIDRSGMRTVGFEKDALSVGRFDALKEKLPVRAELTPLAGVIEGLRMVKDAGEIALIRQSVIANSNALEVALKRLRPGMTEAEFAAEIDYRNRKLGAEGLAFDTIVAAGARAALPHARPGAAKIGPGMLLIDMGAFRDGYASDMTRMVHLGKADAKYRRAYKAVLEAQLAALDAVRAGVKTTAVDKAVRDVLRGYSLEKEFVHSTGHGLGLEIHEGPRIGRKDKTKLAAGMAITIEPGVYIEGWGGIRIEDTVLVTESGCEVLTPTTKDLREL